MSIHRPRRNLRPPYILYILLFILKAVTLEEKPPARASNRIQIFAGLIGGISIVVSLAALVTIGTSLRNDSLGAALALVGAYPIFKIFIGAVKAVSGADDEPVSVTTYFRTLISRKFRFFRRTTAPTALTGIAVLIGGRTRSWRGDEWLVDLDESPNSVRLALGLIEAALRMRLSDLTSLFWRAGCWILAAETRTWGPLGIIVAFAVVNIYHSQGWGTAFFAGVVEVTAVAQGVKWLRKRWGVTVKGRKKQPEDE